MKTAVEWLEDNLIGNPHSENDFIHNRNAFQQAKEKEKKQIEEAFSKGGNFRSFGGNPDYYNETYKN
jgi:hypothetical protein